MTYPQQSNYYKIPHPKECWKKTYKEAIEKWWLKTLRQKAEKIPSLSYLNKNACSVGTVHPVWKCGSDPLQTLMASTKAKLLTQRYPLTTSHTAGKNKSDLCPLCHIAPEDMEHFLLHCTALEHTRNAFKYVLKKLASDLKLDNKGLVRSILDTSSFGKVTQMNIEGKLRRLCHRLTLSAQNCCSKFVDKFITHYYQMVMVRLMGKAVVTKEEEEVQERLTQPYICVMLNVASFS